MNLTDFINTKIKKGYSEYDYFELEKTNPTELKKLSGLELQYLENRYVIYKEKNMDSDYKIHTYIFSGNDLSLLITNHCDTKEKMYEFYKNNQISKTVWYMLETKLKIEVGEYAKKVGQLTLEKDWAVGKLQSLDSSYKKELIDRDEEKILSVVKQCNLINYNRSNLFYAPMVNPSKDAIKKHIEKVFEEIPSFGYMKVYHQLLEDGFSVSSNTVLVYRKELGLQAVLAVRPPNTIWADKQHPKHSYKLRGLDITRANQVWSTDITYIKIKGGMVYMAAIIDWYSKAVLSWRISNTMDTDLVMGVLNEALSLYGKPEIFNTDQGSQYTSYIHTQKLKDNGIIISMDGKGRATDNICIERFWRSAKVEKIYLHEYEKMSVLKSDVNEYMEFYNYRRFHETLKYKKPMNVYFDSLKINDENYTQSSVNVA